MNARSRQAVRRALAAAIIVGLIGGTAQAQQGPEERKFVPSPFKIFRKALDGVRRGKAREPARESAAVAPLAEQPAAEQRGRAPPASPVAARLPKPRPEAAPAVTYAGSMTGLPADPASSLAEPIVESFPSLEEPANAVAASPHLLEMPASFPAAGLEAPGGTLPVPDAAIPVQGEREGLAADQPLGPVSESLLEEAPASAVAALGLLVRGPRARPDDSAAVLAMVDPNSGVQPALTPPASAEPDPDDPACIERLRGLGVVFTQESPMGEGACRLANPLKVSSVGSGVAITPEAILNCRTTEALALWVKNAMVPAARATLNAVPKEIVHGSTFVCRPRNNEAGAKLSEHAQANAVDISAIGFADRAPVDVKAQVASTPEGRFSVAIREESCAYFTTSLGPGSNAAHATHFHFDMAERRGGYRLCDLGNETAVAKRPERSNPEN